MLQTIQVIAQVVIAGAAIIDLAFEIYKYKKSNRPHQR